MTEREREREKLVELLKPHISGTACESESGSCELTNCRDCKARQLADHLLSNGVIVPLCKVGDKVYVLDDFIWASDCGECEHFEEGWYDSPHECRKTRSCRKAPECIEIVERTVTYKDILQYMN